jgi:hypothetical protein
LELCPRCGDDRVHHSRLKSAIERLRCRLTGRVPFRCHACDWRGWKRDVRPAADGPRPIHRNLTDSELDHLDPDIHR